MSGSLGIGESASALIAVLSGCRYEHALDLLLVQPICLSEALLKTLDHDGSFIPRGGWISSDGPEVSQCQAKVHHVPAHDRRLHPPHCFVEQRESIRTVCVSHVCLLRLAVRFAA